MAMSLAQTDPRFQAKIRKIAATACCMTSEEVYALWREYSRQRTDQSALLFEFVEWNADRLGANRADLHRAIEELE